MTFKLKTNSGIPNLIRIDLNSGEYFDVSPSAATAKAKYSEIEEQKNSIKASNGMTYNEIKSKIAEFESRNWGGVVYDEKTGETRFPNLDEIIATLEIKAKNGVTEAQEHLDYIKGLVAAKSELEAKYPDFGKENLGEFIFNL